MFKRWPFVLLTILLLAQCRAFTGGSDAPQTPGAGGVPPPVSSENAGNSAGTAPTNSSQPIDLKGKIKILEEVLGRGLVARLQWDATLLKPEGPVLGDTSIQIQKGKIQGEGVEKSGNFKWVASGVYQQVQTASGGLSVGVTPLVLELSAKSYAFKGCHGDRVLTGNLKCILNGSIVPATLQASLKGSCFSHSNGVWDNIVLGLDGAEHKVRHQLGLQIQGDLREWSKYQWSGTAYVNGTQVSLDQIKKESEACIP